MMLSSSEKEGNIDDDEYLERAEKKRRILNAVRHGDVDSLRTLLNSPRWYRVKNDRGLTLPTIAVLETSGEVLDYLLSLPNYPQKALDEALKHSLCILRTEGKPHLRACYACKLIERGADVHQLGLLQNALEWNLLKVAEILIKRGADVNRNDAYGKTPLGTCWSCPDNDMEEGVSMLLYYGADPFIRCSGEFNDELSSFDLLLMLSRSFVHHKIRNVYFNNMYGVYTDYDIAVEAFLEATELDPLIFYDIVKNTREVLFRRNFKHSYIGYYTIMLFTIKTHFLQIIIEEFDYVIKTLFESNDEVSCHGITEESISIENFDVLMQSHLKIEFTDWLNNFRDGFIHYVVTKWSCLSEVQVQEVACFLLSHGMRVWESDLEAVYRRFGNCELFKTLLHMDVEKNLFRPIQHVIPYIYYNVTLDIPKMILDKKNLPPTRYSRPGETFLYNPFEVLLPYYTIPVDLLTNRFKSAQHQPQVPVLVELARNVFRRYFIKRLNIMNASQFYTFIEKLPISNYHKQIITLEVKLY